MVLQALTEIKLQSLFEIHNTFTSSTLHYLEGCVKMVNCPECGRPLKKSTRKARYWCENDACSVIFVRHPDKPTIMEIAYKAKASSRS